MLGFSDEHKRQNSCSNGFYLLTGGIWKLCKLMKKINGRVTGWGRMRLENNETCSAEAIFDLTLVKWGGSNRDVVGEIRKHDRWRD